ncbi:hypothetical protein L1049_009953 [Liquidambar formosana]|uniref:Uncharacterized protein n=1 Tax=Liquidambar formosana TaxID=63359 RepID=A0AAP0R3W6_LIQFO
MNRVPGKEVAGSSSSENKLPHWLREAVSAPAKPPNPDLPPTVSAIAHSVRLLYGDEKPTIPPFVVPGPPPPQPKDPRLGLKRKKKKKSHMLRRVPAEIAETSQNIPSSLHGDNIASSSLPLAPPFPLLPQSLTGSSGLPWIESDLNLPPPNLNMVNPSSSSAYINTQKKTSAGLSPSPEVLQLVASCAAQGPRLLPVSGMTNSSFLESKISSLKTVDGGGLPDTQGSCGSQKAKQSSHLGMWGPLPKERLDHTESGDSSKTHSDPSRTERPDLEEISSEGTVSDHPASDNES